MRKHPRTLHAVSLALIGLLAGPCAVTRVSADELKADDKTVLAVVEKKTVASKKASVEKSAVEKSAVVEKKPDEKKAVKTVSGQIAHIGKRSISVEYTAEGSNAYEMLLPFSAKPKLRNIASLDELSQGDTVKVQYEQTYREDDEGNPVILKTAVLEVAFVRKAPKESLRSSESLDVCADQPSGKCE